MISSTTRTKTPLHTSAQRRAIKKGDGSISGVIAHPSADGSALAAASSITATSEGGWTRVPSLKRYSIIDASTFLSR